MVLHEAPKVRCHIALRYMFGGEDFHQQAKRESGVCRAPAFASVCTITCSAAARRAKSEFAEVY